MRKIYFLFFTLFCVSFSFAQEQSAEFQSNSTLNTANNSCCKKLMTPCNESSGDDFFNCIASAKGHYIQRNATNQLSLVTNQEAPVTGTLMMHNIYGQLIISKNVNLVMGSNNIELPSSNRPQIRIVTFYVGKQLLLTQKVY